MYQNVLASIKGIGWYGVVSILLFFVFFTGMVVWAFALKQNYLNTMAGLPLESENSATNARTGPSGDSPSPGGAELPQRPLFSEPVPDKILS